MAALTPILSNRDGGELAVADRVKSVPVWGGANPSYIFGPFPVNVYGSTVTIQWGGGDGSECEINVIKPGD